MELRIDVSIDLDVVIAFAAVKLVNDIRIFLINDRERVIAASHFSDKVLDWRSNSLRDAKCADVVGVEMDSEERCRIHVPNDKVFINDIFRDATILCQISDIQKECKLVKIVRK